MFLQPGFANLHQLILSLLQLSFSKYSYVCSLALWTISKLLYIRALCQRQITTTKNCQRRKDEYHILLNTPLPISIFLSMWPPCFLGFLSEGGGHMERNVLMRSTLHALQGQCPYSAVQRCKTCLVWPYNNVTHGIHTIAIPNDTWTIYHCKTFVGDM